MSFQPTNEQILEALSNLQLENYNTGNASYSKCIHTDETFSYLLLVHLSTDVITKKLNLSITVREFMNDTKDDEQPWFNQVYYKNMEF